MTMRRRRYPNYPLRRAWLVVALLILALGVLIAGADYIFPGPGAAHSHSQVR